MPQLTDAEIKSAIDKYNGQWEVYLGETEIDRRILGDFEIHLVKDDPKETETQGGTLRRKAKKYSDSNVVLNLFISGTELMKALYAEHYQKPNGTDQTVGSLLWKSSGCATDEGGILPLHFHPVCNENDDDDIHVFGVELPDDIESTFTAGGSGDDASVSFTLQMSADADGNYLRIGPGLTGAKGVYDPETQTVKPITPVVGE